jgi:DNA-directed RNA polymerase specialized sigma24 family protein
MGRCEDFSRTLCTPSGVTSIPMSAPQTIAELLAALPEEERIILTLHYLRGKQPSEIAVLLAVPERSVHVVIESGKRRLTGQLGL